MRAEWAAKFWERVAEGAAGACWPWQGSALPSGYGRFYPAWKVGLYAHRVAWELANDRAIPGGLEVLHACDNPRCCNPAHLSVGTRSDNMRDAVAKGRHAHVRLPGEAHPNAKLTDAAVREIRRRLGAGERRRALAAEFCVSTDTIKAIASGRVWKHLLIEGRAVS